MSVPFDARKRGLDRLVRIVALWSLWACAVHPGILTAADRPNVIFIMADDLGYGDLGCYGATRVKTPNIDQLARDGMRFTDAHSPSAVCTPTRYALITGQYAWRQPGTGILSGIAPLCIPAERRMQTLPALFKTAGYKTGVVGKWHLGLGDTETDYNRPIAPGPHEIGFDDSFIIPATGDRVPCVYVENGRVAGLDESDPIKLDYSVKRGEPRSFVRGIPRIGAMTGGTQALWRDDDMAAEIENQAVKFIERHKANPFFLYFCTHDIHVPRVPNAKYRGTSQAGVRGDVIQELDATVGGLLAALDRLHLREKTLVMFTSDNGGVLDPNGPDTVNAGTPETNQGHPHNGILRGNKGNAYEGGHRVPFIARWPGHVPAGKTSQELICHIDVMATMSALLDQPLAAEAGPDSFNMLSALLAEKPAAPVRDHLVNHGNTLAIRQGPWKLITAVGRKAKKGGGTVELYDLANDLGETKDLSREYPDKVRGLTELLDRIRSSNRSRP